MTDRVLQELWCPCRKARRVAAVIATNDGTQHLVTFGEEVRDMAMIRTDLERGRGLRSPTLVELVEADGAEHESPETYAPRVVQQESPGASPAAAPYRLTASTIPLARKSSVTTAAPCPGCHRLHQVTWWSEDDTLRFLEEAESIDPDW